MENNLLTIPSDIFMSNYALDIRAFIEKKQQFSYLSWAHAKKIMKQSLPELVVKYKEDDDNNSNLYGNSELGYFSMPYITDGMKCSEYLFFPALDFRNKPLTTLSVFSVNTVRMRAGVKAIATVTGIGLSLYAGEDLFDEAKMNFISRIMEIRDELEKLGVLDEENPVTYITQTIDALKVEGCRLKALLVSTKIEKELKRLENSKAPVVVETKSKNLKSLSNKDLETILDALIKIKS
jgi:hypothetical protein